MDKSSVIIATQEEFLDLTEKQFLLILDETTDNSNHVPTYSIQSCLHLDFELQIFV